MYEKVEAAHGRYWGRFYSLLQRATAANSDLSTPGLAEFCDRGFERAFLRVPGRMIDDAESMLDSYRRNENKDGQPSIAAPLPVVLMATAKDFTPTEPQWGRQIPDNGYVLLPGDPQGRAIKARVMRKDVRAQAAIFAAERYTASAIADFLINAWLKAPENHRFGVDWNFQGIPVEDWPVMVDSSASAVGLVPIDGVKNLTILTVDWTLKMAVPVFDVPVYGEANDGVTTDPAGWPVINVANPIIEQVHR